jgi:copper resistance protein D
MRTRIFVVSLLLLSLSQAVAHAHAMLASASPPVGGSVGAALRQVSLSFTQSLEPSFSSLQVTDAKGARVLLRLGLIALLAGLLAADLRGTKDSGGFLKTAIVVVAAGLAGTLAWAGHGNGGAGLAGSIHLAADVLHLIAAAAWVGGLLPLAFLLANADRVSSVEVARAASLRFSAYGLVAVGTLLLTGSINTWYLAGGIHALTATAYGHLLLLKIALFLVMLALAMVNRFWLTPALASDAGETFERKVLRRLRGNVAIETAAGAVILAVVAVLGVTPPGLGE